MRAWKYLTVFLPACMAVLAFTQHGWWTYAVVLFSFGVIPLLELCIPTNSRNLTAEEEKLALADPVYSWLLYLVVPVQWGLLIWYFFAVQESGLRWWEILGRTWSMGTLCGVYGINVAHELGHRAAKVEQWLAKLLLLSSHYMHFFIEHNRGHHKHVATPLDPATARWGESLYAFWVRSIVMSYLSAWKLEARRLHRHGLSTWSWRNEMFWFTAIQLGALLLVGFCIHPWAALAWMASAVIGILLLETINYIEHYGLLRKKVHSESYERCLPTHSWTSNHLLGRLMLFELSRHSDHHYRASRKYQILMHHPDSPEMPTGYPGMMLVAMVPPVWFGMMHHRLRQYEHRTIPVKSTETFRESETQPRISQLKSSQ